MTDATSDLPTLDPSFVVVEPLREAMAMEFARIDGDGIDASWSVTPETHQPYGLLHGGVHSLVNEGLCSMAAALWFGDRGQVVGVNNNTDFYRGVSAGRLTSTVRPVHRGRSQQVWAVETTDDEGRLVARGQVRLQNLAR
ncbi:PaaI family thioesterase [Nocardioides coralli]|uniref:PaaI family thioesterase n=1 Tax=Nocardioides coralli TaxID=2872154 RepID=UPI0020174D3F|nr:PaaI family thioesterase [Nocardioides coralli]